MDRASLCSVCNIFQPPAAAKQLMPIQHMSTGNVGQVCWARPPANRRASLLAAISGQGLPEVADMASSCAVFYTVQVCVCGSVCVSPAMQQQRSDPVWPASFVSMSNIQDRSSHLRQVHIPVFSLWSRITLTVDTHGSKSLYVFTVRSLHDLKMKLLLHVFQLGRPY